MELLTLTNTLLQQIPQKLIPNAADGAILQQHQAFFEKHKATVIQGFYDFMYDQDATKQHLSNENRTTREALLSQWYEITMQGHFDQAYWAWQALVGIVHIKHKIPDSAVLGMWSWLIDNLNQALLAEKTTAEVAQIMSILHKVQATVCSVIIESAKLSQQEAIKRASGLNPAILNRFIEIEINELLKQGRAALAQTMQKQARVA